MELKFPEEAEEPKPDDAVGERMEVIHQGLLDKNTALTLLEKATIAAREHLHPYIKITDDMFARAKALTINNDATNVDATALGTSAMTLYKKITNAKEQTPLYVEAKAFVDAVDAIATMLVDKLHSTNKKKETVVSITKEKISQYAVVQEAARREQEALERKAREDLQKKLDEQAKKTGVEAPKVGEPLVKSKRETTVRTETGSAYATHRWDFEILKPEIPRQLVEQLLNSLPAGDAGELKSIMPYVVILYEDTRIRKVVKDGLRNIHPSIRIYEKIDTKFKT